MDLVTSVPQVAHPDVPQPVDTDIPKYSYAPLDTRRSIRVLHLLNSKDRIECRIEQNPISECVYQALSYVWGNSEQPHRAIVRDENNMVLGYLLLTSNLRNALCDLRDSEELPDKTFWIDQICIAQEGEEKNHQVAMMGDIYSKASRVIIYLGPSRSIEEDTSGIELLNRIYDHFKPILDELVQYPFFEDRVRVLRKSIPDKLPEELQIDNWPWLLEITAGEWTQRLWMIQEQLLNRNTAMLRGYNLIPHTKVASINELIFLYTWKLPHLIDIFWESTSSKSFRNWWDAAAKISTIRRARHESFSQATLPRKYYCGTYMRYPV